MNEFCKKCKYRGIPKSLKNKFNENYKTTFIECSTSDSNIVHCMIPKNFDIDWNSFCAWLEDHNLLTIEEALSMARLGILKERKGGRKIKE